MDTHSRHAPAVPPRVSPSSRCTGPSGFPGRSRKPGFLHPPGAMTRWPRSSRTLAVFLVAEDVDAESAVGYLGMHHILDEGFIANLAVHPAYRRQGHRPVAAREAQEYAEAHDLARLTLEVRASNVPAIALYEGMGFTRDGIRPGFTIPPKRTRRFTAIIFEQNAGCVPAFPISKHEVLCHVCQSVRQSVRRPVDPDQLPHPCRYRRGNLRPESGGRGRRALSGARLRRALPLQPRPVYRCLRLFRREDDSARRGGVFPRSHMLTVGIRRSLHELEHQPAIDETRKDGGFVILCHPNWQHKEYWPRADMDRLTGYLGIEIINQLIYRLSGSGLATDAWDHLLSSGRLVYGFGNDDFHLYSDAGRSWNWIYAPSSAYPDIREAVEAGRFTASTGLALESLALDGEDTPHRPGAAYEKQLRRHLHLPVCHRRRAVCGCRHRTEARFTLTGESYVRVEVIGENGACSLPSRFRSGRLQQVLSPQRG